MNLTKLFAAALFVTTFSIAASAQNAEHDAVRVPLENYIRGHATGDGDYMRRAFHAEGNLIFIRDGKYTTRTFAEYIAGMKGGKPAADESNRRRSIERIDVYGNAASAKVVLDHPNVRFVDYMSLLKIGDEWKIVNKIFYAQSKTVPETKKTQ